MTDICYHIFTNVIKLSCPIKFMFLLPFVKHHCNLVHHIRTLLRLQINSTWLSHNFRQSNLLPSLVCHLFAYYFLRCNNFLFVLINFNVKVITFWITQVFRLGFFTAWGVRFCRWHSFYFVLLLEMKDPWMHENTNQGQSQLCIPN